MAIYSQNTTDLKQKLVESHPEWRDNIDRWRFLIDSFMGGKEYRDGKYLTAYQMESQEDYETRLDSTPYDNHVRAVVSILNSFLFRQKPDRYFGNLQQDPNLEKFLKDADFDGRSFDAVMRDVSTYSSVYGHTWVILDKPPISAFTLAEQLEQGIRPYISIVTPENVLDWNYDRNLTGYYELTFLKTYEGKTGDEEYIRVYTKDEITLYGVIDEDVRIVQTTINQLGKIPAVCVYSQRSHLKGLGISDVGDVADMCRAIYNEMSEIEQLGRLTNHPSLVKTPSTQAGAGAGAIIQMPDDLMPELKPYLLQPDAASLEGFLQSYEKKVEAIDRMTHMGGIRSIESRRLSGVALATEFQLLNARLAEKAQNLGHAEEQIWKLYSDWQQIIWNGAVEYPTSFNIQDKYNDMNMLKLAKEAGITSEVLATVVEREMLKILVDDSEYQELKHKVEAFIEPEGVAQDSTQRRYPDGEPISDDLPQAYQLHTASDMIPQGQMCKNCAAYTEDGLCTVWNNAPVRAKYWCKKWVPIEATNVE